MNSLQEQLLKAGLSDKKKAKQAKQDRKKQHKEKRHNAKHKIVIEDPIKKEIQAAKERKQQQDQAIVQKQKIQFEAKELQSRIKQTLEHNGLKETLGDFSYNFTYTNLVKRLDVTEQIHKSIIKGTLAICVFAEQFFIIPTTIATRLAELDPQVIAVLNEQQSDEQVDEDDPYADFAIPDDLMW